MGHLLHRWILTKHDAVRELSLLNLGAVWFLVAVRIFAMGRYCQSKNFLCQKLSLLMKKLFESNKFCKQVLLEKVYELKIFHLQIVTYSGVSFFLPTFD